MADQKSIDQVMAIGEAPRGSKTVISAPESPSASTPHTVKQQEDGEEKSTHEDHVDRLATLPSAASASAVEEQFSPVPSATFSEAPTLLTGDSAYTANTGGRAHQSWRGGIANFWRPSGTFLSNDPSPSDSSVGDSQALASISTDVPRIESSLVEQTAGPVAEPDEPRSFFDSDSESEGETVIRTASRASSLRGQRPRLIQNHSSNGSLSRTRFYQSSLLAPPRNPGPSHTKAEQILGARLKNLLDLTPALRKPDPFASFNGGTTAALNALTANSIEKASTTALEASASPTPTSFDPSLVIEVPDTRGRVEALDTLPTPFGGFGTIQLSPPDISNFGISPLDALRSNPVTRFDTTGLHRATSAPPLPHRRNRKFTIRPVDVGIIHTANQKKLFRDSVVSTPYPTRHHSIAIADRLETPLSPTKKNSVAFSSANEKNFGRSFSVTYISPPEVLILELSLAKHPLATKLITIPIYDRSTFDDQALFTTLRSTYNHTLLGFSRRFLTARTLSNATFAFPSSPSSSSSSSTRTPEILHFDISDFLTHLQHPQSGHKRKTWLQWLRKHQPHPTTNTSSPTSRGRRKHHHHPAASTSSDPYFSADGLPRTPAFVHPRPPPAPRPPVSTSNPSSPSSSSSSSPPTSASNANPNPNPTWAEDAAPASSSPSTSRALVPRVVLHHSFSLPRIASAVCLVLGLTVLAAVLWVLLGVPGRSAAAAAHKMVGLGVGLGGAGWRVDAQKRVLTGLVMAVLVFLMGAIAVVGWVGGSWVVL